MRISDWSSDVCSSDLSNERTRQDFAETVLKSGSNLVRGAFGSTPPGALAATGGTPVPMIGGTVQTTTARPDIQDALNRLGEIDEVNILCAPDQEIGRAHV